MIFKSNPASVLYTLVMIACLAPSASASSTASDSSSRDFETIDKHPGNFVRVAPDTDWSRYKVVRLAPSTYEPSDRRHSLSPHDAEKVLATFDASLHSRVASSATGEGAALEVRPIITDIKRTNSFVNLASFLALRGLVLSYGAASVRYEFCDAATGKTLGEITSRRHAYPWNVMPWDILQNFEALGQSSVILKSDAKQLRKDLGRLAQIGQTAKVASTPTIPWPGNFTKRRLQ